MIVLAEKGNLLESIEKHNLDGLVNAANGQGPMGGGIAGAIRRLGGEEIQEDAIRICTKLEPKPGYAYLTISGKFEEQGIKKIIHGVTMKDPGGETSYEYVEEAFKSVLSLAVKNGFKRIGCTAFGTGVGGLDPVMVASRMKKIADEYHTSKVEIVFMDFDENFINALNEKFFFFYRHPLGQWNKKSFDVNKIKYNCAEQYMMAQKALIFGDFEIHKKIMEEESPKIQRILGRKVKGFNQELWNEKATDIVFQGNYAKFTQNEELKEILLSTKGSTLVEASPTDFIWGIKIGENDERRFYRHLWKGQNLLGEILMKVRQYILEDDIRNCFKLGIDIHGTIDFLPKVWSLFSNLLVDNGHQVHIMTGSKITNEIKKQLYELGIKWTHIFSITDYHESIGTEIIYDSKGNPWMDQKLWNKTKAEYAKEKKLDLMVDDSSIYLKKFETPCVLMINHLKNIKG